MDKEEYIRKWIEGSLSEEEKKIFEQSDSFRNIQKISDSLRIFSAPDYSLEEEWQKVLARRPTQRKKTGFWRSRSVYRLAAIFIILSGLYYIFLHQTSRTVRTGVAENREINLPDSTSVILNAKSHVTYSEKKWNENRKIDLDGEAFFSVVHGSKFRVITFSGIISVLGTRFNVKNRPGFFEVTCYEGLVQVENNDEIIRLPPHHMYRLLDGNRSVSEDQQEHTPSWVQDESSFQSIPFYYVIREFERQYDMTIEVENVNLDQLFTGRFVNSDLVLALQSITFPLNLKYQIINNKRIVLSNNPG